MIVHHHYKGDVCRGVGALPYEQDDSALRAARAHWDAETKRMLDRQFDHARRRLNEPLPSWHFSSLAKAASEAARLGTRLYRRTYCRKAA